MKKHKRHFNRLRSIKVNAELPQDGTIALLNKKSKFPCQKATDNGVQNASALFVGLTIVSGLTLLGISPDLGTNTIIKIASTRINLAEGETIATQTP